MKRIKFKKFAGVKIRGKIEAPMGAMDGHLERAEYLTAAVESGGKFGCAMNYDGTGMTAGIHQAIAVYPRALSKEDWNPKNDQGPLWKLLNRIKAVAKGSREWLALEEGIQDKDWYLSPDGSLRDVHTGGHVLGQDIRKEFSGAVSGNMPAAGEGRQRSEFWVRTFHELFSLPSTFDTQRSYGMEHFVKRAERTKLRFSGYPAIKRKTIQAAVYGEGENISICLSEDLDEVLDLAMCMFWSHTVNAPGAALKKLSRIIRPRMSKDELGVQIIRKMGNTKFGRWDDDIKNGRYQRTRRHAMSMGVWDPAMFKGKDAVMPRDLPG